MSSTLQEKGRNAETLNHFVFIFIFTLIVYFTLNTTPVTKGLRDGRERRGVVWVQVCWVVVISLHWFIYMHEKILHKISFFIKIAMNN